MSLVACPACGRSISRAAPTCPQCGHPMALSATVASGARLPGAPGAEEELWRGTPSARSLLGSLVGAAVGVAGLLLVSLLLFRPALALIGGLGPDVARAIRRNDETISLVGTLVLVALVVLLLARVAWRLAVLKSHRYRITNQRIVVETGVFSKRIEEIDMRTVDDFQLEQSLIERLLGIGDVVVMSSDRTAANVTLQGLRDPRQMRELIRSAAYQATRGQLFTRET